MSTLPEHPQVAKKPHVRYSRTVPMKMLRSNPISACCRRFALLALCVVLVGCAAGRPLELEDVRTETPIGAVALFDATGHPINAPSATLPGMEKREFSVLALSGGGADGAFGAGVLCGWSQAGNRPRFDIVTGVSTGALMASLVFAGPEFDSVLQDAYTTIRDDDIYEKKSVTGVFSDSLLDDTPLKEKIESIVTEEFLDRVAGEHRAGRRLYVATTNLDSGEVVVWDMGFIAASDYSKRVELYRSVLRASAAVPGLFKPVYIQPSQASEAKQMHVDGSIKAPLLLRGFMLKQPAVSRRVYVIVNGQVRLSSADKAVKPEILDISRKSIEELLRGLLHRTLYQAYVTTRQSKASFAMISIPDNVRAAPNGLTFKPDVMKRLFEIGSSFGRSGGGWTSEPPRLEDLERIDG
ncbi:MAG: patatin-like phospholipase family protein [Pseudomonadota bacterium]|nr:patatin-like phospholipase family protein [Pseudomonadota bacterium]